MDVTSSSGLIFEVHVIDSAAKLQSFLGELNGDTADRAPLFVDIEGDLRRDGHISIIQIFVPSRCCTYLLDVQVLQHDIFDSKPEKGQSFKQILESPCIEKSFFDVRNDSHALYVLYGIRLQGIEDIQLLELAGRRGYKKRLSSLYRCVESDAGLPLQHLEQWMCTKRKGRQMFEADKNASMEPTDTRPLDATWIEYCVGDVAMLPLLSKVYKARLNKLWREKAAVETERRIQESVNPGYDPQSKSKGLGPLNWWQGNRKSRTTTKHDVEGNHGKQT